MMSKKTIGLLTAAGCTAAAVGILTFPAQVAEGVRSGLTLCGQTLIPALFPFMALAMLLGRSAAAGPVCRLLGPVCRRWLRLPQNFAPVLLMSFIGGYPTAAKLLSSMLKKDEVTPQQAQRLLFFAVSPAPSFAVLAVGAGLLGSVRAGMVLYGCHLFTALLLGGWQARRHPAPPVQNKKTACLPFAAALVESTAAAVEGMLAVCGFVLLFSALLALLQAVGLPLALGRLASRAVGGLVAPKTFSAAFCGMLEVTCGVFACGSLDWRSLCVVIPFLVSFGSLSVVCQISACLGGCGVKTAPLVLGRLVHGLLSTLMAAPMLWQMAPGLSVWAQAARPLGQPASLISTFALLGAGSLLLLSLDQKALPAQRPGGQ